MFDEIVKIFEETISNMPPMFRYSFLLLLADLVNKELPKAKKDFITERDRIVSLLLEVLNREED